MLAYALFEHEGALRASLQAEYGIRLSKHDLTLVELCDYTANLPAGSALWRSTGGPLAWSEETHLLNLVDFRLQVLAWIQTEDAKSGKNKPVLHKPPKWASERAEEELKEDARAAAWAARQHR